MSGQLRSRGLRFKSSLCHLLVGLSCANCVILGLNLSQPQLPGRKLGGIMSTSQCCEGKCGKLSPASSPYACDQLFPVCLGPSLETCIRELGWGHTGCGLRAPQVHLGVLGNAKAFAEVPAKYWSVFVTLAPRSCFG